MGTPVNTSKKHILSLYHKNVVSYDSNRSRHSLRRSGIVDQYRRCVERDELVTRNLNGDGKPFVMVLVCGKSTLPPYSWTMREIPWCLVSEVK